MSMTLFSEPEGQFKVMLGQPEKAWVKLLAGKMLRDEATILGMAIDRGLIELMTVFGRPTQPAVKP